MIALLIVLGVLLFNVATVLAFPPTPSSFVGTVKIDGINAPLTAVVSAWINGVKYAYTTVALFEGETWYSLDVPGDDASTPAIEGGTEGQTIVFRVDYPDNALVADQTGTWHSGTNPTLNLTASPTAIELVGIQAHNAFSSSSMKVFWFGVLGLGLVSVGTGWFWIRKNRLQKV